jgi:hypothetical protein
MMLMMEKLAYFESPPSEVFDHLREGWSQMGYKMVHSDEETHEMVCTARSFHRVRVDIKTLCVPEGKGTVVQMLYSPALTPAGDRPMSMNAYVEKGVRHDLEDRMQSVLRQAGTPQPTSRENIHDHPEQLGDLDQIRRKAKRSTALMRMLLSLIVALLGTLMSYLHFNDIFAFGPYELWMSAALIGVIVFCVGLFSVIWAR